MIRSQILNNAYFSSANDGSLEQVLKKVGFEKEGKIYWKSGELPGTVFCKRKFDFFR